MTIWLPLYIAFHKHCVYKCCMCGKLIFVRHLGHGWLAKWLKHLTVNLEVAGSSTHQSPPAHPAVPGVQVHLTLSHASSMVQVGLRVPTPLLREESGLLRVPSPAPGVCPALALSACLVHRHPGFTRCVRPPSGSKRICI